jgi:hypothetical protein
MGLAVLLGQRAAPGPRAGREPGSGRVGPGPDGAVEVWAVAGCGGAAACPDGGTVSSRVHGTVATCPADVRRAGDPVALYWVKRRLKCGNASCLRKTFTERVPAVPPGTRVMPRLKEQCAKEIADRGPRPPRQAAVADRPGDRGVRAARGPVAGGLLRPVRESGHDRTGSRTGRRPYLPTTPPAGSPWPRPPGAIAARSSPSTWARSSCPPGGGVPDPGAVRENPRRSRPRPARPADRDRLDREGEAAGRAAAPGEAH